jgi:ribose 5-phosphate isomerase B
MAVKVYIASDHAGFDAKDEVKKVIEKMNGYEIIDFGPRDSSKVDYPYYAKLVAKSVSRNFGSFGILICGSGTGMAIAANKVSGIRATFAYDVYSAKMARFDNDANVLTLRAREFDHSKYEEIVKTFLNTKFSGYERHKHRISKLE